MKVDDTDIAREVANARILSLCGRVRYNVGTHHFQVSKVSICRKPERHDGECQWEYLRVS